MKTIFAWLAGAWINWLTVGVGIAAVVGSVWFGVHQYNESLRQEGRDEVQAKWDKDKQARALLAAADAEAKRVKDAQHAQDIAKERADRERDAVIVGTVLADTRGQLDRLRRTNAAVTARLAKASQGATPGPGADGPAEASGSVFDECTRQLVGVAGEAEGLAQQLRGLQAWAGSAVMVCGEPADHQH